jgi:hypothetical protein
LARDLGVSPALVRAAEKYDEASASFDAACIERFGCGEIDERYADLAFSAAEVLRASIEDRTRAVLGEAVLAAVAPYERGERRAGDTPEDDIVAAERVCREVRSRAGKLPRASS